MSKAERVKDEPCPDQSYLCKCCYFAASTLVAHLLTLTVVMLCVYMRLPV